MGRDNISVFTQSYVIGLKKERWHRRHIFVNKVEIMLLGGRNLIYEFTPNRRKIFIDKVRNA